MGATKWRRGAGLKTWQPNATNRLLQFYGQFAIRPESSFNALGEIKKPLVINQ
jgi:hypothetical protein